MWGDDRWQLIEEIGNGGNAICLQPASIESDGIPHPNDCNKRICGRVLTWHSPSYNSNLMRHMQIVHINTYQNIQNETVLIDRAPQPVFLATHCDHNLVEVPFFIKLASRSAVNVSSELTTEFL